MVVHGRDGLDELTTTDVTYVAMLEDGVITRSEIAPGGCGPRARAAWPSSKAAWPTENAEALTALFAGEPGAYRDIVLLNAAGGPDGGGTGAADIMSGMELARQALDSGAARGQTGPTGHASTGMHQQRRFNHEHSRQDRRLQEGGNCRRQGAHRADRNGGARPRRRSGARLSAPRWTPRRTPANSA